MTQRIIHPALRLLAALAAPLALCPLPAAGQDQPACRYLEVARVPLHYTGPALDITIDGAIDGTPALMMIDTGASETFLTRTGTERRGLRLRASGRYSRGIGGTARLYDVRVRQFAAGPSRSARGLLPVIGQTGMVPSFDAIVGAPFLLQTDVEISLADKVLKFFRPDGCRDAYLGYWDNPAIVVPFERGAGSSPNPHFTVLLNGHKLDAIIDSGAATSAIELDAARRAGLTLDAPGVARLPDAAGIGERRVARWSTVVDTLSIGTETIRNAEMGVLDTKGELDVDVLLGADFLRAHRVLFAMEQEKLYLAYLGGPVFSQRKGIEPWMQREADGGNADAQFVLAHMYQSGRGVARDASLAALWLDKADAQGQPQANLIVGRRLMLHGKPAQGAARLKAALDKLPAERYGALWLYAARLQGGDPALAKGELEATFARSEDGEWPAPIAGFYLGRIDAARLLAMAGDDSKLAHARTCQAMSYMAELRAARGEKAESAALLASMWAQCPRPAPKSAAVAQPDA